MVRSKRNRNDIYYGYDKLYSAFSKSTPPWDLKRCIATSFSVCRDAQAKACDYSFFMNLAARFKIVGK